MHASPPPCVQAGSDAESPGALLAAAVQCRAAKALRTLLTLPSNCTAFVGMGACMQRLPKLLLSGTSGSQQLSSVLVRAMRGSQWVWGALMCLAYFVFGIGSSQRSPAMN